jgi:hypothetical protein
MRRPMKSGRSLPLQRFNELRVLARCYWIVTSF